jgi:hypothetical protein
VLLHVPNFDKRSEITTINVNTGTGKQNRFTSEHGLIAFFGAITLLIHLLTNSRYGYFRDELYYIACGRHLAFGYVDQPPLSIGLVRLSNAFFGESLFALRLLPAIAGSLSVALTGAIARQLGGRTWAIALSCTASLCALVFLVNANFFSMNAFEPLFWMGCAYLLVRIINSTSINHQPLVAPKRREGGSTINRLYWLWFGVLAGLGLENKHSMAFFAVGLVAGILLTPARRHLTQRWIWLGGLIACLIALPNVLWQVQHHWPTWELLSNVARSRKNVLLTPAQFLSQQILIMNPATLPLWLGGLLWLVVARAGRRYAALAIAFLVTLVEFIALHGKIYYLAPAYPMLFAAGAVATERLFRVRFQWMKPLLLVAMIGNAAVLVPIALPILSPAKLVAYMRAIHFEAPRTESSHTAALPQHFADQFGWEEMATSVSRAYRKLSPNDRKRAAIFAQNYGEAGAIDFFGRKLGLPPAISGHQNYYLWGPRDYTSDIVLVLDDRADDERKQFQSVEDLGQIESSPWAMPYEQELHIFLCRGLKMPLGAFWPSTKNWL